MALCLTHLSFLEASFFGSHTCSIQITEYTCSIHVTESLGERENQRMSKRNLLCEREREIAGERESGSESENVGESNQLM